MFRTSAHLLAETPSDEFPKKAIPPDGGSFEEAQAHKRQKGSNGGHEKTLSHAGIFELFLYIL